MIISSLQFLRQNLFGVLKCSLNRYSRIMSSTNFQLSFKMSYFLSLLLRKRFLVSGYHFNNIIFSIADCISVCHPSGWSIVVQVVHTNRKPQHELKHCIPNILPSLSVLCHFSLQSVSPELLVPGLLRIYTCVNMLI